MSFHLVHAIITLAALLHDIGKVNLAFQKDLGRRPTQQLLSHDLVGAALLRQIVWDAAFGTDADRRFLDALSAGNVGSSLEKGWTDLCHRARSPGFDQKKFLAGTHGRTVTSAFRLSTTGRETVFGQVLLLVLCHHRLPTIVDREIRLDGFVRTDGKNWNRTFSTAPGIPPWRDAGWCEEVARTADLIIQLLVDGHDPKAPADYVETVGRLVLTLADHAASALGQDRSSPAPSAPTIFANTHRIVRPSYGISDSTNVPYPQDRQPPPEPVPGEPLTDHLLSVGRMVPVMFDVIASAPEPEPNYSVHPTRYPAWRGPPTTFGVSTSSPVGVATHMDMLPGDLSKAATIGRRVRGHLRSDGQVVGRDTEGAIVEARFHGGDVVVEMGAEPKPLPPAVMTLCGTNGFEDTTYAASTRRKLASDALFRPIDDLLRASDPSNGRLVADLLRLARSDLHLIDPPAVGSKADLERLARWIGLFGRNLTVHPVIDSPALRDAYEVGLVQRARAAEGLSSDSCPLGTVPGLRRREPTSDIGFTLEDVLEAIPKSGSDPSFGLIVTDDPNVTVGLDALSEELGVDMLFMNDRLPPFICWEVDRAIERVATTGDITRSLVVVVEPTHVPRWAAGFEWTIVANRDASSWHVDGWVGGGEMIHLGKAAEHDANRVERVPWARDGNPSDESGIVTVLMEFEEDRTSPVLNNRFPRSVAGSFRFGSRVDPKSVSETVETYRTAAAAIDPDWESTWDRRRSIATAISSIHFPRHGPGENVGRQRSVNLLVGCFSETETGRRAPDV